MQRKTRFYPGSIYFWILAVFLYAPILLLIVFSFNDAIHLAFPLSGFTLRWYGELARNRELLDAVQTSVVLGLGVSLVASILGTMGAIAIVRFNFIGRDFFTAVAAMPLVIPYVILGVSSLILFSEIGIPLSAWAAGIAHVVIAVPYALLVVAARLVGFPHNLEEAAMDLGTTYWGALLRVTLPICAPAIMAAFLVCFTISFDEYAISSFLVGTQATLPVYLYSQLRFPRRLPIVVTLAAILMVASMVILLLAEWLRGAGRTSTAQKGK
jgi:spermidine/putrescine transport system permease protein